AFFEELEIPGFEKGPGYYAITRHADIVEMSRRPEVFCSGQGAVSIQDMPPVMSEFFGSFISMDDPRHARLRGIVSRAFTPKRLTEVLESAERIATEVVDDVADRGEVDFTIDIAARLPMLIIMDMLGIPRSQYDFVLAQSNVVLAGADPEFLPPDMAEWVGAFAMAGTNLALLVQELAAERRENPTDDLISALVTADVDGDRLTPEELGSFFILLVSAGNETTRTAISHGLLALSEHPGQRARWMADFDRLAPTAVEEIVRWASPVIWMRRTVTEPVEVGGHPFAPGDKVVLFYNSANRDEAVFTDPYRFDVGRDPNPHIGFGAPGPHFCLGAHLARREITVMFRELFHRLPDIEISGPPEPLLSDFINGIKHLPATFTPVRRSRS
ncbi:MAG TPA: cytochrome P450, partial [Acidimicrobiia bacterium]|nr:cytochrome P450 [Acidimicrobiia bacterium]